jgi:hypothetical protein
MSHGISDPLASPSKSRAFLAAPGIGTKKTAEDPDVAKQSFPVKETAAIAAGHLLARAALKAYSFASSGSEPSQLAYDLFDLEGHELAAPESYRVRLICEKLTNLLTGSPPEASWDEVERVLRACLPEALGRLALAGTSSPAEAP